MFMLPTEAQDMPDEERPMLQEQPAPFAPAVATQYQLASMLIWDLFLA